MIGTALLVSAALQLIVGSQGAGLYSKQDDEAAQLAAALSMSGIWPPFHHSVEKDNSERVRRDAEEFETEKTVETEADDQAEEHQEDCDNPPATGLRRWVIRMRNFLYGRRDLEGSAANNGTGEEDGSPPPGRTWMESLAHWFAHGIKRILIRISGSENPNPDSADEPEVMDSNSGASEATTSTHPWTALPPVAVTNPEPEPTSTRQPDRPRTTAYTPPPPSTRPQEGIPPTGPVTISDYDLDEPAKVPASSSSVDETNEIK